MNRWMIAMVLLATTVGYAAGTAPQAAVNDEQAVRDATARFYAALNVLFPGDAGPVKDTWSRADDVTYMGPVGGLRQGWAAVQADWDAQAAQKLGGRVQAEDLHVTVGRDLAVVSNWEKGQNASADGKVNVVSIRATNVFRKESGVWKMIGHHTDLLPYLAK
ncbi:MAG: nuclear transport factor 2 family protein [Acidobacteria bacterium]|nr:nuclear transport factor 2 family protein [Acidobacteriota bacterium]